MSLANPLSLAGLRRLEELHLEFVKCDLETPEGQETLMAFRAAIFSEALDLFALAREALKARPAPEMTLGEIGLVEETLAPSYGPGKYAFRVGDLPEEAMRLPNMQNPDTLIEMVADSLPESHQCLTRYLLTKGVIVDGRISPPVARYRPHTVRKRDRKN